MEEALTVARYLPRVGQLVPAAFRRAIPEAEAIYLALAVVTLIPIGFAVLARRPGSTSWATYGLLLVAAVLLVNIVWHLLAAAALGGYSPGVVTAVVINLPVTILALRWAIRNAWLSRRGVAGMLLVAVFLHGPIPGAVVALAR